MIPAGPFIDIMRRASHCGYATVVMNNRMLLQCYDLNIDSDNAMNYVLYIPDTEAYKDPFYDKQMILAPKKVLDSFGAGKKLLDMKRRESGAKPKEAYVEMQLKSDNGCSEIKFMYFLSGELLTTTTCQVQYPVDNRNPEIANCELTFQKAIDNIKPGGACLVFDGVKLGLQPRIIEYPSIYFYKVKYHGKTIEIPFYKSMFLGMKDVDNFYFSIQESRVPNMYVYSYQLTKRKITEQLFGYGLLF